MLSLTKRPKEYSDTELKYLVIESLRAVSGVSYATNNELNTLKEIVEAQHKVIESQTESIKEMKNTLDKVIRSSALDVHILPVAQVFAYGKFPIVVMSSGESLSRFAYTILPNGDCVAWLKGKKANPPDDGDTRLWKKGTWYKAEA